MNVGALADVAGVAGAGAATAEPRQSQGAPPTQSPAALLPATGTHREPPGAGEVQAALAQLEEQLHSASRHLQFRVDEASGRVVVSVVDAETGECIRQIPGEEMLRLARLAQVASESDGFLVNVQA